MVLGHPSPIHRQIQWSCDLEKISSLRVVKLPGRGGVWVGARSLRLGGAVSTGTMGPEYCVLVDSTTVYLGRPQPCEEIQRQIDDARNSRMMVVMGRLQPYQGVATLNQRPPLA